MLGGLPGEDRYMYAASVQRPRVGHQNMTACGASGSNTRPQKRLPFLRMCENPGRLGLSPNE